MSRGLPSFWGQFFLSLNSAELRSLKLISNRRLLGICSLVGWEEVILGCFNHILDIGVRSSWGSTTVEHAWVVSRIRLPT